MAASQNHDKDAVRLPQSAEAFFTELSASGSSTAFATGSINQKSDLPSQVQQMLHYSYHGLANGRPLNKVMIVLVGQSGAGKSTTINALFNDSICQTNSSSSETRTVTEYGKELCVQDPTLPAVIGTLSFVDVPGALDVDQTKEATNLAVITKFRDENPDLRPRKGFLKTSTTIRELVYPNMVLMAIHASDSRMHGPDSNVRKCLRALDKYRFLDRVHPNLMVVVTHSMAIPRKSYAEDTARITRTIQEAICSVLRIRKVQVVFVENMPEQFSLTKPDGGDFYELPNGELSHYNLITAMEEQFNQTGDVLGKLLCGWYFSDDCPEKKVKANVLNVVEHATLSPKETEEALQMLASIDMKLSTQEDIIPPAFDFHFLGRGYCLKSESPKNIAVYRETDTVKTRLLNTLYTVPKCFKFESVGAKDENHFLPVSSETKDAYQSRRVSRYGLEDNIKLVVHAESNGRWIKDMSNHKQATIRAAYEKHLLFAKIDNPDAIVKEEIVEALNNLPESYNLQTVDQFHNFFNTCGTHFVHETYIGGYVTLNNPVMTDTHTEAAGVQTLDKVKTAFKSIVDPERGVGEYGHVPIGSDDRDVKKCTLIFEGGDPPQISLLTELTAVRYSDWIQTVKRYPVELQYSLKLYPYYALVKNAQRKWALTKATEQYLQDTTPEPKTPAPVTKYANLQQRTGPNPKLIETELKLHLSDGYNLPSQIKRNDVSSRMVQKAQIQAKKRHGRCEIL